MEEDQKSTFPTPSQNLLKSSLNLVQIRQFWSNRVGDPFGRQGVGAGPQCAHFKKYCILRNKIKTPVFFTGKIGRLNESSHGNRPSERLSAVVSCKSTGAFI